MSPRKSVGTATERALARMLTENTGTHFLDSGGAYGRAWQRQQGKAVTDFLNEPEISVEVFREETHDDGRQTSDDGYVTLSVFHYLRARLEYSHPDTLRFLANAKRWDNGHWLQDMDQWAEQEHEKEGGYDSGHWPRGGYNSYNDENALSQEIQFETYTSKRHSGQMVILQIHGGADVRGGYTAPKIFHVTSDEPHDLFDWGKWGFSHHAQVTNGTELPGMPLPAGAWRSTDEGIWYVTHSWEREGNQGDGWVNHGGSFDTWKDLTWQRDSEADPWGMHCPECGATCEVHPPSTW